MLCSQNLFCLEQLGHSCVTQHAFAGFPDTLEEVSGGSGPGELGSKLPRKAEPEQGEPGAVKKRELLPQEDAGAGGEGGGLQRGLAVAQK